MTEPVIETVELNKTYETTVALQALTLAVPRGSIYGFLGRNGAGKTTAIKILLGMVHPSKGLARVFGLPAGESKASVEIRQRTGFVSESKDLYDYMTVEEIIRFTRTFYPRWRSDLEKRYLRLFELPENRKIKTLSRGMRAKVALVLALSRGAELLILDEPTSGLDPAVAEQVLQALISHVANQEMTIFFSSHHIAEVDQIADNVTIIDKGSAVVTGALDELRKNYRRIQLFFDSEPPKHDFQTPGIRRLHLEGRVITILTSAGTERVLEEARSLGPTAVDVVPVTLKEIFLEAVQPEDKQ